MLEDFWETPEEVLCEVRAELEDFWGKPFPLSPVDPDGAVRLAEWANWTAKQTGDYTCKVLAFAAAAALPGVGSGWGTDEYGDDVFYIQGPIGPSASAHDPYGELYMALREIAPRQADNTWSEPWDGVVRQPWAYEVALELPAMRQQTIASVAEAFAELS